MKRRKGEEIEPFIPSRNISDKTSIIIRKMKRETTLLWLKPRKTKIRMYDCVDS